MTNGPSGLLSLSGVNVVDTGTVTLTSLDPFHDAKAAALADGAELSVFVLAPDVALALSKAKQLTSGSNVGLLDANGVGDGSPWPVFRSWSPPTLPPATLGAWTARRFWSSSAPAPRSPARPTPRSTTTRSRSVVPLASRSDSRTPPESCALYDAA